MTVLIMEYGENEWKCGLSLAVSLRPSSVRQEDTLQALTDVSMAAASFSCKHKSEAPRHIQSRSLRWERWRSRTLSGIFHADLRQTAIFNNLWDNRLRAKVGFARD